MLVDRGGSSMRLEQYTADAICRSMGLDAFEPTGPSPAVRVLLKPSFHPEVCLTLTPDADPTRACLSVVALTESFWRQQAPRRLPELREEIAVPADVYSEAVTGLASALADRDRGDRMICVDGMGIECCHVSTDGIERFAEHVYRSTLSTFLDRLIWVAWTACRVTGVRNALADCAWYLGKDYPRESDPERPPVRRVLILGEPDARAEYFELLRSRAGPG